MTAEAPPPIVNKAARMSKSPIEKYKSKFKYILMNNAPPNKSAYILKILN